MHRVAYLLWDPGYIADFTTATNEPNLTDVFKTIG
jgi:hypothetical protein